VRFEAGLDQPFFLIAGPCTAESEQLCVDVAGQMQEICSRLGIPYIFKASYDKANRSSGQSVRGPGIEGGLRILETVRARIGVPVLTDVHDAADVAQVASVVDVLQTPAFLCRQTDFIHAVASCGKPVNIKKGQFLAPGDMKHVVAKAREVNGGADNLMVCERGASFGYNNLVSDMRSLAIMRETGCPVVFDATHSVQLPGGQGTVSGGQRNSSRCWHGRRWQSGFPVCSWKPIPARKKPFPTAPIPGRWRVWKTCCRHWWRSIAPSRQRVLQNSIYKSL